LKKSLKPNEPVPALFQDPAYSYSSHWYLSTSQLSSEYFTGYGWGQVVPDGFGIAYMVKNNTLQFNVASVRNMNVHGKVYSGATTVMVQCLEDAADDMREVFEADLAKEVPKSKL
jgi:carnitine O-acetyltransferase